MKARSRLWKVGAIAVWCALAFVGLKFVQPKMRSVWPGWVNDALDGEMFHRLHRRLSRKAMARYDIESLHEATQAARTILGALPKTGQRRIALRDPWGRPYRYIWPNPATPNDPNSYDLFSLGPDGVVSSDDIR